MIRAPRGFKYTPTYQGAPIQEVKESLAMGANEYEKNLEEFNVLEQFKAGLQSLPGDTELLHKNIDNVGLAIKKMNEGSLDDRRFDLAGRAVDTMSQQLLANPAIRAIGESYKTFLKGEEDKATLRLQGKTPLEFSDPTTHKSVDEKGNVNIYRPIIEPKGNYIADAAQLWASTAPRLLAANLTKSDVQGILEGKTVKGITPDMIREDFAAVKSSYQSTDSYKQQRKLYQQTGAKNPDKNIDDFLLGIGLLKVHQDVDIKYQDDPTYPWEMREKIAQEQVAAMYKKAVDVQNMKKKTGRPSFNDKADIYFGRRKTVGVEGKSGFDKSQVIGINASEISNGLSETIGMPESGAYQFLGTDNKHLNAKLKDNDIQFTSPPKIIGIVASDAHTPDYRGGFYANVQFREGDKGKMRMGTIIIKNGDERMRNTVSTVAAIENQIAKPKLDTPEKGYMIPDTSGLLSGALDELRSSAMSKGLNTTKLSMGFVVKPKGDSIHGQVEPVIIDKDGKHHTLSNAEAASIGLRTTYDIDDIYKMTQDQLAGLVEPYFQTSKSLQDGFTKPQQPEE